jgi:tetratricopeptide (TPR) repeat protein
MMKMDPPEGMQQPSQPPQPRTRLVQARLQMKLSQKQVAARIGTSFVNVSRWERGITRPGPYFRRRLATLYGRTEEEIDLAPATNAQPSSPDTPASSPATAPPGASPVTGTPGATHIAPLIDPSIPPSPLTALVGRDTTLAQLKQRLCSGVTLTALNGLPGVGKTTLAITIARDTDIQEYFHGGILWAGLGPQPNMPGIASHWGGLLGISQAETGALNDLESWAMTLRSAIGSRRMLLVIDDAWHLQDALALKVGGPHCAYLMTTRSPAIASQLGAGSAITIRALGEGESVALLRMLAPRILERETQRIRDLAQAVGGLPLALTLAGNYLRRHAYSGQPRRVEAALDRLSSAVERLSISEQRGPAERHPSLPLDTPVSLQSVIAVTDAQLNAEQQAALRALAIFPSRPDSFPEEAALAVANCSTEALDSLVDAGLLECDENGRYTMHQTIADYARSHLEDDTPYARLANYMAGFVAGHKKNYALLEQENSSILAALDAAHRLGMGEALMRCIYAYIPYLRSRGLYNLAEKHLRRAYEAADSSGDIYGKAGALLYLGEIAQKLGNYEQASTSLREGLNLARQAGKPERITALLADLGWVTWKRGEYTQAEHYLNDGLTLAREIDDKEQISDILETLGSVAASRGEYNASMKYVEEALEMAREIRDQEKICTLLINLGVTEGERGKYEQAKEYFLEGLQIAQQIGHREWMSLIYSNLGDIVSEQEDYILAEKYFQEGLVLVRQIGNREWVSGLLSNLGQIARKQGHNAQAKKYLEESLIIAEQINRPQLLSEVLYAYGNFFLDSQETEVAENTFRKMIEIVPDGSQDLFALAHYGLARAIAVRGNIKQAREIGDTSLTLLETMGHRSAKEVRDWMHLLIN